LDNLKGHHNTILDKLDRTNTEVVDVQMVDTLEKARSAGDLFARENVSLLFLHIATYALSSTVLPVARKAKSADGNFKFTAFRQPSTMLSSTILAVGAR